MIRVRDDDVLIRSSSWDNPLGRFQQVHKWICDAPNYVVHVPAILVTEIQEFPEAIEFIRNEAKEGRMDPQLHGLHHIDYGKLTKQEVKDHLKKSTDWMAANLNVVPTVWYTPWGAGEAQGQEFLWEAAEEEGFDLVTCKDINKLAGRYGLVQVFKEGHDPRQFLWNKEIFFHWWEGGARLLRVMKAITHGSWRAAELADPALFKG